MEDRLALAEREKIEFDTKLELEILKLAQLEKEFEVENTKSRRDLLTSRSSKVDSAESNLENLSRIVKILTIAVSTKLGALYFFLQSLEEAFCTTKILDDLKPVILMNILGSKAQNVLILVCEKDIRDYES